MTTDTLTVKQLAAEAYSWFEVATRTDDSTYIRTKDGCPEWVSDLVYAGHGSDFLPDDYRYRWIMSACGSIADTDEGAIEDSAHEWADCETDVYTGRLLEWLASNLQRVGYVDSAAEEMGIQADEGIVRMISAGQYEEIRETFELVWQFLQDRAEG